MKDLKDHNKIIDDFIENVSGEKLEEVDFDQFIRSLKENKKTGNNFNAVKNELEKLRRDYIGRMSGMAKAVAVVSGRRSEMDEMLEFVESLESSTSDELLKAYRRIQSKFQDSFPASFGMLSQNNLKINKRDLQDLK